MSSPSEPEQQGSGGPPNGEHPTAGGADVPPWQRGPGAGTRQSRPPADAPPRPSSIDERINRFISRASSPASVSASESEAAPESEAPSDPYRSELPDLSGPVPRSPAQRKPATERKIGESAPKKAIEVAAHPRGPLRAGMQIRRVDPWTVLKVSLVLNVALFFVWMIAVAFLYLMLGAMGVWSKLNSNVGDLLNNPNSTELVSGGTVFGAATLIGLVNIVLLTAMATIGAFIYNLTTDVVGGVEVTLADRD